MGTFDWAIDLAKQLIDANGEACGIAVFHSVDGPAGPQETTNSTVTAIACRAVFLNYNTKEAGQTYQDGDIHRDDKKVLVAAKGLVASPNLNGEIARANGDVFRILKIKCLDPAGPAIYYELQVRR